VTTMSAPLRRKSSDRLGQAEDLRRNGADIVVTDLAELL